MSTSLATLLFSIGVAGLFFLDRNKSVRTSLALWIPVAWLWLNGSRPPSSWFGGDSVDSGHSLAATLEGSPADAAIYATLVALGLIVLIARRKKTSAYLSFVGPITVYFAYCLLSVAWSPIPGPSFKRWTKALGDLVVVLVILTEVNPVAALQRFFARVGFILLPFSVMLIRWSSLGRGFDVDGTPSNTGVTTNKNTLGLTVYTVSLGALWNVCTLLVNKDEPNRGRRLVAQCTLLGFGLALLQMAHSSTSIACFMLGGTIIVAGSIPAVRRRPARLNSLFLFIVLSGVILYLSGGQAWVAESLGRKADLSGRSEIWQATSNVAGFTLIGTGFESFWNAKAVAVNVYLHEMGFIDLSNLVSAHNGFLEVYCDLGLIGLCLIVLILITGCWRVYKAVPVDVELGSLFLAYIATGIIYSITEAGFRMLTPTWTFLLLALIGGSGISAGLLGRRAIQSRVSRGDRASPSRSTTTLTT